MTTKTDKIFVRRDAEGKIIEVSLQPGEDFESCFAVSKKDPKPHDSLVLSDLSTVRVLEDLIDLLINRDLITFTDLPQIAQQKLLERRSIRSEMQGLDLLGDEEDEII